MIQVVRSYEKVSLNKMFELIVDSIIFNHDMPRFFWLDGENKLHEIVECDLMRGRFIMDNQDFSEFSWELKESRIFVQKDTISEVQNGV